MEGKCERWNVCWTGMKGTGGGDMLGLCRWAPMREGITRNYCESVECLCGGEGGLGSIPVICTDPKYWW